MAQLLWDAADGLNENERAVLELSVRQGLAGEELAAALGMTRHHANVVAGRMRSNLERSVGALALVRTADGTCDELAALLDGFDGNLTPLWRKRIARHADGCDVCESRRSRKPLVAAAIPLLLAPSAVRARVLEHLPVAADGTPLADPAAFRAARSGFPVATARITRIAVQAGAAAVAAVLLVVGVTSVRSGDGPTEAAAGADRALVEDEAPARTSTTAAGTTVVSTPDDDEDEEPAASDEPSDPPEADPTDDADPPPSTTAPVAVPSTTRPAAATGPGSGGGTIAPPPTTTSTIPPDVAAPTLTGSSAGQTALRQQGCDGGPTTTVVTATGADDRGITGGRVEVRVGPITRTFPLSGSGGSVSGTIGPFEGTGSMEITVLWVADAAGNRSGPGTPIFGAVTC
jgi:hypothetical protein